MSKLNKSKIYEMALKIRLFEKKLLDLVTRKQITGTVHTCTGQEVIPVIISENLINDDVIFSNHRGHGHFLAKTKDFRKLALELMGDEQGLNKGIGGSQHLKAANFYASGVQGSLLPFSLGISFELQNTNSIVVVYLGDGTFGQGVLYEVFNLASLWKLPILFVIEDNGYAQSTKKENNFAGSFQLRAKAFDISFFGSSSFQIENLWENCNFAVKYVRDTRKPAMLHIETYRLSPHSKGDDLRDPNEVERFLLQDEVNKFEKSLKLEELNKLIEENNQYFDIKKASYSKIPRDEIIKEILNEKEEIRLEYSSDFISKRINLALTKCFENDQSLMMIGEDLMDPYGGAFKISKGLSSKFPGRILNTPISEATIVGFSAGRSARGKSTIVEIMFGDFVGIAFDQILNVISKFHSMYGQINELPLIIRMAVGPGGGYGATHSQEVSQHLSAIPFLEHRFPTVFSDIEDFYLNSITFKKKPIIIYEAKKMYSYQVKRLNNQLESYYRLYQIGTSGTANILLSASNSEMTLLLHPSLSTECEELLIELKKREVTVDVFIPECLNYFSFDQIKKSLIKTKKLFIWDSGHLLNGRFSDLLNTLESEIDFQHSYQLVPMVSIPASSLEQEIFYNLEDVIAKLREFYER